MSLKQYRLIFAFTILCVNGTFYAEPSANILEKQEKEDQAAILNALLQRVIKQIDSIDLSLEALAQGIHSNIVKTENKKPFREYIGKIRDFISKVRNGQLYELNISNLSMLVEINKNILAHLNRFAACSKLDIEELFKLDKKTVNYNKKRKYKKLTQDELENKVELLDLELKAFEAKLEKVGLTDFNVMARNLEKSLKRKHIDKIVKRSLPYAIAAAYSFWCLDEAKVKAWNIKYLTKVKEAIGTTTLVSCLGETFGNVSELFKAGGIVKPFVEYTPNLLLVPFVKKDASDLHRWGTEQYKKFKCKLKGDAYEDPELPKRAKKINFEDIIGISHVQEELNKILNYFQLKKRLDLMGAQTPKGYLFVGPIDYSQKLAQALGNEITKIISKKQKDDFCGIWQIHASELVKNSKDAKDGKLGSIVKQIKEKELPCIIFINEFDWLFKQEDVKPEVWTDVITTITSTVNNPKVDIFVIAAVKDENIVRSKIKDPTTFPGIIKFGTPNLDDRKEFFNKELKERCIDVSNFDIEMLAEQTENCSLNKLESVIKRALAYAHTQNRTVNQNDLEQYINQIVYNINLDERTLDKTEKTILSAHFAGKTLAHTIIKPNSKLVRVTILPVSSESKTKQGAIISFDKKDKLEFTQQDFENKAILELVGIEAQRELLKSASHKLISNANKKAFKYAKQIVLAGFDERCLGKKISEEKSQQAFGLVQDWTSKAQSIVTQNKAQLNRIFEALNNKTILTTDDVKALA